MFNRLSLQAKLALALLLWATLLGVALTFYQLRTLGAVNAGFDDIIHNDALQLQALNDLKQYSLQIEGTALNVQGRPPAAVRTEIQSLRGQAQKAEQSYAQNVMPDDIRRGAVPIKSISSQIDKLTQEAAALYSGTSTPSAAQLQAKSKTLHTLQQEATSAINDTLSSTRGRIDLEYADVNAMVARDKLTSILAVVLLMLFAVSVGLLAASRISRSIKRLRAAAQRVANGDFSEAVNITSKDEIGQLAAAFNQMSARLKESYRRLAVEKKRDEAILQDMGEGLVAVDDAGKIVLMNQVAADLLDLNDMNKAIGMGLKDAYKLYSQDEKKTDPLPSEEQPINRALKTGESLSEVYSFHKADGAKHLLNISATPIKLDTDITGAIAVIRDVTKEKEVDRMKTEFISLASHQLRTPLSAIKWFTEMLVSGDAGELQPEQLNFAKNISDSTERMIALVNALLNISRIESGRIVVDPKPTDLKELVTGIVNDLKAKTEQKQQSLIISVHAGLPKINLDPRLIGQVYLNLLTNAIKYTPKGGEISVFISRKDDEIISQVTDNGYGIPKEQQDRIFQKFFRAINAVKVETDGTGLGLYLIKAIVESSGGRIWFESEEGKGTTFWFSIPASGMKPKEGEVTLDA